MTAFKHRNTMTERRFDITDAPEDLARAYSEGAIRPDRAKVSFIDGRFSYLEVSGLNVKKGGATGERQHHVSYSATFREDVIPEWLLPLTGFDFKPEES